MKVGVKGEVIIRDKEGKTYRYKNQVQQQLIQAIIQYAQTGGTISNYSYAIQLLSNGSVIGVYTGSMYYQQISTSLELVFTFIISDVSLPANTIQLYLLSSLGSFLVAQINNITLPSGSMQIIWTLSFDISPQDYFTPYLIFAFFSPPSNSTPFNNTPLTNVQSAINAIQNIGYLSSPPTYYITYNGQYIEVNVSFSNNSISIYYQLPVTTSITTYNNLNVVVTASNGYVNLIAPIQQIIVQVGQLASISYNVIWTTS